MLRPDVRAQALRDVREILETVAEKAEIERPRILDQRLGQLQKRLKDLRGGGGQDSGPLGLGILSSLKRSLQSETERPAPQPQLSEQRLEPEEAAVLSEFLRSQGYLEEATPSALPGAEEGLHVGGPGERLDKRLALEARQELTGKTSRIRVY